MGSGASTTGLDEMRGTAQAVRITRARGWVDDGRDGRDGQGDERPSVPRQLRWQWMGECEGKGR